MEKSNYEKILSLVSLPMVCRLAALRSDPKASGATSGAPGVRRDPLNEVHGLLKISGENTRQVIRQSAIRTP